MPLWKVALLSFAALITMVNPLAVVPSFIALTDNVSRSLRARVALVAGAACMVVLAVFLLAGTYVFKFFGITVPAFQIMGGILFLTTALRTLVVDERRAYNVGPGRQHTLAEVADAVRFAESSPEPLPANLFDDLYSSDAPGRAELVGAS